MPHTASRYQQDLGFTDGRIRLDASYILWDIAAQATYLRNAVGDWSVSHVVAANTTNFAINLTGALLRRIGFGEDLQEQFGGTGIPGSAQPQVYRPDASSGMSALQEITPRTALKTKGFKLLSFDVIYLVGTAALTTHTARVDQSVYVNNVAIATTAVLAPTALATATQANPYVTNVALPAAQQIYRTVADGDLWIEVQAITAATTVYRLYGVDAIIEFNYN